MLKNWTEHTGALELNHRIQITEENDISIEIPFTSPSECSREDYVRRSYQFDQPEDNPIRTLSKDTYHTPSESEIDTSQSEYHFAFYLPEHASREHFRDDLKDDRKYSIREFQGNPPHEDADGYVVTVCIQPGDTFKLECASGLWEFVGVTTDHPDKEFEYAAADRFSERLVFTPYHKYGTKQVRPEFYTLHKSDFGQKFAPFRSQVNDMGHRRINPHKKIRFRPKRLPNAWKPNAKIGWTENQPEENIGPLTNKAESYKTYNRVFATKQ